MESRRIARPMLATLGVFLVLVAPRIVAGQATEAAPDASPPDAATVAQRMKAALEPTRPSTRKLALTVSADEGEATQLVVGQARDGRAKSGRALSVMLSPPDARGMAYLVEERSDLKPEVQWLWIPTIRRVRKLVSVESNEAFLNTDFTYSDIGFLKRNVSDKLLGTEEHAGVRAYKLESIPEESWYLSRIITWVATGTFLPLERDFFDPAGALYKVERYSDVTTVDGTPTPLRIRMENVQAKTSTEMVVSELHYDVELPPTLLDPDFLRRAASAAVWSGQPGK
ncbi:MAG TPA: outer membrane lipoprotein-sorting protein [Candidatus Bathyarchaeia archaeon]|nr:outer membrane lipoprotein-sorting protein [Candidatus Bathyarchaeia archaeon]